MLALTTAAFVAVVRKQRDELLGTDDLAPILWLLTAPSRYVSSARWSSPLGVRHGCRRWTTGISLRTACSFPPSSPFSRPWTWIDASFSASSGPAVDRSEAFGWALVVFSALYAGAMVIRYVVRMARRPDARWFGGTIPIVFHLVLATYVYALGSFHVGS